MYVLHFLWRTFGCIFKIAACRAFLVKLILGLKLRNMTSLWRHFQLTQGCRILFIWGAAAPPTWSDMWVKSGEKCTFRGILMVLWATLHVSAPTCFVELQPWLHCVSEIPTPHPSPERTLKLRPWLQGVSQVLTPHPSSEGNSNLLPSCSPSDRLCQPCFDYRGLPYPVPCSSFCSTVRSWRWDVRWTATPWQTSQR